MKMIKIIIIICFLINITAIGWNLIGIHYFETNPFTILWKNLIGTILIIFGLVTWGSYIMSKIYNKIDNLFEE